MSQVHKHVVSLTDEERAALTQFVSSGVQKARALNRARILLLADEGKSDQDIGQVLGLCRSTLAAFRKKYREASYTHILDLLQDAPRPGRPLRVDSRVEAHITTIACSDPPEGAAKWTLRLIADRLVQLEIVEALSHERVRQALKKTV